MDELDLSRLKKEMAESAREAKNAGKRFKVTKTHLTKTENNWEALISLANEISEPIEVV